MQYYFWALRSRLCAVLCVLICLAFWLHLSASLLYGQNKSLSDFLQEVLEARPQNESELRQYPQAPAAGTFGHQYYDNYAIDPAERPIPQTPALPLDPAEQERLARYRKEQNKMQRQQERRAKNRFNDGFRLGFGLDAYIGFPNFLDIGPLSSGDFVPTPYLFNSEVAGAAPLSESVPVFNNYYEVSMLLHLMQFLELKFGFGYQSDAFFSGIATSLGQREYFKGRIKRTAIYAIKYQKDTVFYDMGISLLLPWVLSGKSRSVLGLRLAGSVAFGIVTDEYMGLVRPSLPESVNYFNNNPVATYKMIEKFPMNPGPIATKIMVSFGGYFEIIGFRLYLGYSLRFYPEKLYTETTYQILQNFSSGGAASYSSIGFPEVQNIHTVNLNISYFLNLPELLGRRSIYHEAQKKRRTSSGTAMQSRLG